MSTIEWFRNPSWSDVVAIQFEAKLARARRKEQYLRIQASTLASVEPDVAHKLLDRYLALPDQFDQAQAHVDRAVAYVAQERLPEAVASYEAALAREAEFPKLLTLAYLELPYLVGARGLREHYPRATEILKKYKSRLMFPLDRFKWNAAMALIHRGLDDSGSSRSFAGQALAASKVGTSGLRYHPDVGLVGVAYSSVIERLNAIHDA